MAEEQGDVTSQRPREIESQIAQTRAEMDQTIDQLGERLRPSNLIDEAACWFREKIWGPAAPIAQDYSRRAYRGVLDHPLAAAALGATAIVIAYQMQKTSSARPASARGEPRLGEEQGGYEGLLEEASPMGESMESAGQGFSEGMQQGSHRTREWTRRAREGAAEIGQRMSERMSESTRELRHRARHMQHRVREGRERASQGFEQYPLFFGAAALGFGLMLGMALPTSRRERRLIGPAAERARRRAREMGHEVYERGRHAATEVAHAAREAAEREGLTPEQLRERAARVADETQRAAEREIRPEEGRGQQPGA